MIDTYNVELTSEGAPLMMVRGECRMSKAYAAPSYCVLCYPTCDECHAIPERQMLVAIRLSACLCRTDGVTNVKAPFARSGAAGSKPPAESLRLLRFRVMDEPRSTLGVSRNS